jgi:resuscitation-promoting factor RpfB
MAKMSTKVTGAVAVGLIMASGLHSQTIQHFTADLTAVQGGSVSQNITLGEDLAAGRGWTGSQWSCEYTLWDGESGWSHYADSRRSGLDPAGAAVFAYGIPQARPATKMPRSAWPADLGGQSNPRAQIEWGDGYIAAVYGNPCNALAFKRAHGNRGY